jgi:L-alanine-DL-glutamate epimerase-like enolase superfamily enzyme
MGPLTLRATIESWPLTVPFRITGHTFEVIEVLAVTLGQGGLVGHGEAAGIYFRGEQAVTMLQQVEAVRGAITAGISRDALQHLLPPGGARNAVDCALWDLEAKITGRPVWQALGLAAPRPLLTTFGCGADTPENMALAARAYTHAQAIKLKLTGEPIDADRVRAVREACPDVWLSVDANQGFTRDFLRNLLPVLVQARVSLIEQPFPVGQEALLEGFDSPIPIAADECALTVSDLRGLSGRFDAVNIKLDKSGGLTEAMRMARAARELGLDTLVGNMIGTSLAMAPSFLVGQLCSSVVDLDGPLFLKADRALTVHYGDGRISCPEEVWGAGVF